MFFALLFGKLLCRLFPPTSRRSALGTGVALALCPDLFSRLAVSGKILYVTGSDGKTSVGAMVTGMLRAAGCRVVTNCLHSGEAESVALALVRASTLSGKVKCDYLVLEADGRTSDAVLSLGKPAHILVTDLLSAHGPAAGRTEAVTSLISRAAGPETELILNGMDPACIRLCPDRPRVFFGAAPSLFFASECKNLVNDGRICPNCHHRLNYDFVLYHHIGRFSCPHCGLAAPECEYLLSDFSLTEPRCSVNGTDFLTRPAATYNYMNVTAAAALVCRATGCDAARAGGLFAKTDALRTVYTQRAISGRRCIFYTCRPNNPVAFDRGLEYVASHSETKTVLLYFGSDSAHESIDCSWLYDVTFEFLKGHAETLLCAGARGADIAARLCYAGIPARSVSVIRNDRDLPAAVASGRGPLYVLADSRDSARIRGILLIGGAK